MYSGADDAAAFAHRPESRGHECADRRVDDGAVELLGRSIIGSSAPACAHFLGEGLRRGIAGPRKCEHIASLPACDLRDDVSCGAEAVEPDLPAIAGETKRTPADQARAEQRRCRHVVAAVGKFECIMCVGNDMRGVAAVTGVTGEERVIAQVLTPAQAKLTMAASAAQPRNADTSTDGKTGHAATDRVDAADNLV